MKTDYTIFRPDGTSERASVDWPDEPGYVRLKTLIEPLVDGPLEHVTVLHNGERADMFVDEMGHLRLNEERKLNVAATRIYHEASRSRGDDMTNAPTIVGVAVLFDRQVWH